MGVARNLAIVTGGNVVGAAAFVVVGYLAAPKTDGVDAPQQDAGQLPGTLRKAPETAAA